VTKSKQPRHHKAKSHIEVNQPYFKRNRAGSNKRASSGQVTFHQGGMGDISISLELKDHVLSTKIIVDNKNPRTTTGGVPKLSDISIDTPSKSASTIQWRRRTKDSLFRGQDKHKKGASKQKEI